MSRAALSVFIFGLYLILVGLGLVASPNTVLGPLGFPASSEPWPRVVGVLALCLSYYYISAARAGLNGFFRWTVSVRVGVFLVFGLLVLLKLASAPLVLLGAVDLLAAVWTGLALRASSRQ